MPAPGDAEEVETLLEMGAMLWKKGDRVEALRFLDRAVSACPEGPRRKELEASRRTLAPPKVGQTTLVSRAAPPPAAAPEEAVLSERDVVAVESAPSVITQRFDYDRALEHGKLSLQPAPEPALPANVLPAVRVWILPGPEGGRVVIAEGPRPTGAADAILLSVVPGADIHALLARRTTDQSK